MTLLEFRDAGAIGVAITMWSRRRLADARSLGG